MFSHVLGDEVLAVVHAESDDRDRGGRVFTSFVFLVRGFVQSQDEGEGGVVFDHRDGGPESRSGKSCPARSGRSTGGRCRLS